MSRNFLKVSVCRKCDEFHEADGTNICAVCKPQVERDRRENRPHHHTPESRKRMRAVVGRANADPSTECWLCESRYAPPGYDPTFTADHAEAGDPESDLYPAHRGCNSARGNRTAAEFRASLAKRLPWWFLDG